MARPEVFIGSDNVFKDLGLPDADEHLLKARLVHQIDILMKERKLKQIEAAGLFGIGQPDVSKMLHGDFRQFSAERLMRFLMDLGQDIEIVVVKPGILSDNPRGHLSLVVDGVSHAV